MKRDRDLLEAVHAGDRDHRRDPATAVAWRQVQPRRKCLVPERYPDRLDAVVGEPRIARVARAFALVVAEVLLVVLVDGPLRGAPMHGRHEEVLAGCHPLARRLRGARLGLPTLRGRLESGRGIREFLDALSDRREVCIRLHATGRAQIGRARLVPIDAIGTDDVVDEPALLDPAARARGSLRIGIRAAHGRGSVGWFVGLRRRPITLLSAPGTCKQVP